jgi:hypothetical protein
MVDFHTGEYRRESGRPTMVSSVAFSLYDGGDSEDESDEEEELAVDEESAVAPAPPVVGKKTLMACIAAVQLGILLVIAEIGNSRMPAGFIPAGTVTQAENIDLWTFIMLSLAFASLWCLRSVAAPGEDVDPATACFLSRAQANEWKGWMQVAFVAYHYTNAQDVYVPIRWCVSAYVWLTGFGNGVYFWASADFSPKRFVQQIWRMNFLAALLAMATNTAWIDYYFVALATVHFVLIFISLGIARLLGKCLKWPSPDRKRGVEACDAEKFVAVWKSTSEIGSPENYCGDLRRPPRHRADEIMGTMSRRWRGRLNLISTQVRRVVDYDRHHVCALGAAAAARHAAQRRAQDAV